MHPDDLTPREREIVDLILTGQTNHEIALTLSLAYETVKWYTKRIYSKLHIGSRTDLILHFQDKAIQPDFSVYQLPRMLTRFIGREREIHEINKLLENERLISLTGPGGTGKTRLAVEIGTYQQEKHPVLFVPVLAFDTVEQVVEALSHAFSISLSGSERPVDRLLSALPDTPALLILDNCETLPDIAPLLPRLLERAPRMKILVTSRSILRLQAEFVYMIGGLPFGTDDLSHQGAVALFTERAAHHQFQSKHDADSITIQSICHLLEGNPLAIELAASWVRVLTCEQILLELQQGIDILQSRSVDMDERHRSMAVVCEHAWQMLSTEDRSPCNNWPSSEAGFLVEAAQAIAGASRVELASLVECSMDRATDNARYQLHDVLRIFALGKMSILSRQATQIRERHAHFYMTLLSEVEPELRGKNLLSGLHQIERELDNITQAWRWMVDHHHTEKLIPAMLPLARFLSITDRSRQGAALFAYAMTNAEPGTAHYAGLLVFRGWHEIWLGNTTEGAEFIFEALALFDKLNLSGTVDATL